jgi:hypothetical protein
MMSEPMPPDGRGMRGYVLRYLGVATFKLAIVVGYDSTTKTFMVRLFRAATKQWTKSKARARLDELSPLADSEKSERRTLIENAIDAASDDLGLRAYA